MSLILLLFVLLTSAQLPLLPAALPGLPEPDPVLPLPSATSSSAAPATIPAFPEQSDVSSPSSSSCPLSLPADLVRSISAACPADRHAALCCPSLAASLYTAFAPAALALPPAARSLALPDLPDLPDDSESCAGQVDKSLRARGVRLPRLNDTCDVAYCFCGVRLRRLSCPAGPFLADRNNAKWAPTPAAARRLQRDCRRPGLAGCNRCLRALDQLSPKNVSRPQRPNNRAHDGGDRECQLMGLSWLLSKNWTLYRPAATSVIRAYMAAPGPTDAGPATCAVPHDEMPYAVGSDELDGSVKGSSPAVKAPAAASSSLALVVALLSWIL